MVDVPYFFLQYLTKAEYLLTSLSTALKTTLMILNNSTYVWFEPWEKNVLFILYAYVIDGWRWDEHVN
jgi:hypothetical protein